MDAIPGSTMRIRELNTELVRDILRVSQTGMTKADLAKATGLSVATCANILAQMTKSGEALALDKAESGGGRPPLCYAYNPSFSQIALIMIKYSDGKKTIHHRIADAKGAVVNEGIRRLNKNVLDTLDKLLMDVKRRFNNLKAASLAIPGLLRNGIIGFCDIEELVGVNIEEHIIKTHGIRTIADNDVNISALGYNAINNRLHDTLAYVYLPKKNCAGAGIVVNGELLRGTTGFAGEVSFLPLESSRKKPHSEFNAEAVLRQVVRIITTIVPIINPSRVIIATDYFTEEAIPNLLSQCVQSTPEDHMPEIFHVASIEEDCFAGLYASGSELLTCGIRLQQLR